MANIYKHPKGYRIHFRIYFPDGHKDRDKYRQSRELAEALRRKAQDLEKGSRSGDLSPREVAEFRNLGLVTPEEARTLTGGKLPTKYDLEAVCKAYLRSSELKNTAYAHKVNANRLRHLRTWFATHPIPSLQEGDIQDYLQGRAAGRIVFAHRFNATKRGGQAPKTLRCELQILQQVLDEAVKLGIVDVNVARQVTVPVRTERVLRAMTSQEVRRLLEAARSRRELAHGYAYELMMLAVYTGFRRAEIRSLRWREDVDLEAGVIRVQAKRIGDDDVFTPKSGQPDSIGIPTPLLAVLKEMDQKGPYVFGGEKPINDDRIYKVFKRLAKLAGLPADYTLHTARHTFGSHMLRKTRDLRDTQRVMRHKDIASTKKYMHVVGDDEAPELTLDYEGGTFEVPKIRKGRRHAK